jgi:hypothetical protein
MTLEVLAVKMLMLVIWVVTLCGLVDTYQRNILPPSSGLKMQTICSSKILVSASNYKSTQFSNPDDQHWQF